MPAAAQLRVTSAPTVPSFDVHEERRTRSELASWAESDPGAASTTSVADSTMALIGRIAVVITFAALVALLTIFVKPLWQGPNADFADIASLQIIRPADGE